MFSNFRFTGVILILIALYSLIGMYTLYLREKCESLKSRIVVQNQAILQWKKDSDKLSKELIVSQKRSFEIKKEGERRVGLILREHVSNQCEEAMKYLLQQGENFGR